MSTLFPQPVKITIDSVADGVKDLIVGKELFAIFREDNLETASHIRNDYRYSGTGVCDTQNKIVAVYKDETKGELWGTSTVKPERYFIIRETPI